jgi:hypothetical protein
MLALYIITNKVIINIIIKNIILFENHKKIDNIWNIIFLFIVN